MTPESERKAFIRSICANPADDTARLAFADWLDDNGEPERAEFIRVQCHPLLGNFFGHTYSSKPICHSLLCDGCNLRRRERELFCDTEIFNDIIGRDRMFGGLRLTEADLAECELLPKGLVSRGDVSRVELPCAEFMRRAADLFAQHPIEGVRLTDRGHPYPAHGGRWVWWKASYSEFWSAGIPDPVFESFSESDGGIWHLGAEGQVVSRSWETSDAACDALSQSCTIYGRTAAHLPPLSPEASQ